MVDVYRRSFSCDSTTITSLDNYIRVVSLHTCILEGMTVISKTWSHSRRLYCFIAMYTYIPVKLSTGNYTNIVMMYIVRISTEIHINVRENGKANQEWTIQRHWQH